MKRAPHDAEQYRLRSGPFASDATYGNNGAFFVPGPCGRDLKVIVSDEGDWEHVSVSLEKRPPNWAEMCFIKDLFWYEEEMVVQYHPPKSEYVNCHPHCLHLWRTKVDRMPMPPTILVGPMDIKKPTAEEVKAIGKWRSSIGLIGRQGAAS